MEHLVKGSRNAFRTKTGAGYLKSNNGSELEKKKVPANNIQNWFMSYTFIFLQSPAGI